MCKLKKNSGTVIIFIIKMQAFCAFTQANVAAALSIGTGKPKTKIPYHETCDTAMNTQGGPN